MRRTPETAGELNGRALLTWVQVVDIRAAVAAGTEQVVLAHRYKVHKTTIGAIVHHRSWRSK